MPRNVKEGEGIDLSEKYFVGNTFPIFILTNSKGDVIQRWIGYNGPPHFVRTLQNSLNDLTTVDERVDRYNKTPTFQDAFFLARYFADVREYLKAVEYYRESEKYGQNKYIDYRFNIFQNMANAAWNYVVPFEDILPAADDVLKSKRRDNVNLIKMVRTLANVARKLNKTDKIAKYLQAGIEITAVGKDEKSKRYFRELSIDKTLHVDNDTAKAINMKKSDLGDDMLTNPDKFYKFAEWCLKRKVNLEEARKLALKASKMAGAGIHKGKVVKTLAGIYAELDRFKEAVRLMELAAENDPDNDYYLKLIKQYRDSSAVRR